jgi:hypothetical protein
MDRYLSVGDAPARHSAWTQGHIGPKPLRLHKSEQSVARAFAPRQPPRRGRRRSALRFGCAKHAQAGFATDGAGAALGLAAGLGASNAGTSKSRAKRSRLVTRNGDVLTAIGAVTAAILHPDALLVGRTATVSAQLRERQRRAFRLRALVSSTAGDQEACDQREGPNRELHVASHESRHSARTAQSTITG